MIPAAFDYQRPASVDEALGAARGTATDAKVLAGGQSLLPLMKLRLAAPDTLIDIGRLAELRGVGQLRRRRLRDRGADDLRRARSTRPRADYGAPARRAAARSATSRSATAGTVGGSIAHADPASDLPALLLALDAEIVAPLGARRAGRSRSTAFFEGPFQTGIAHDELLTEILLPGRRRRRRLGVRVRSSSRRPATPSSAWPRSSSRTRATSIAHGAASAITGRRRPRLSGDGGRGGAGRHGRLGEADRGGRGPRCRRHRRSTATSTPIASTGARWPRSTRDARSRRRWPALA